jgi:tetratricopeptide (TPR) repeat protein
MRSTIQLAHLLVFTCSLSICALAQHDDHAGSAKPAVLMPGFGNVHHPIATGSPEAQKFFDQGLALAYGFNHDEAERSFRRAAELDPKAAMPWWGVAYVAGPNYNLEVDPEHERTAYEAIQKALKLAVSAPEAERDYIDAMSKRYSNAEKPDYQKLANDYHEAMRALAKKYPEDLDAATIYAESGMDLHPWKLWKKDGAAQPGTEEIVSTLESVIRRDPEHIGACHFYIHAVEASTHPERAADCARRLAQMAPASGHLVHMPAHMFIRVGNHLDSEHTNELAAKADEAYMQSTGVQGVYPAMYYTHNLHFITIENSMMGRYAAAMESARKMQAHVDPFVKDMPMVDFFAQMPTMVMVRFRRWDDILQLPQPGAAQPDSLGAYHYARGLAFADKGRADEAKKELAALQKSATEMAKIPTTPAGPENAGKIPQIMAHVLEARIALAGKDNDTAIHHLQEAVPIEDSMDYNEPPDWFMPVRETLGGVLLRSGKAAEAEQIFRRDLEINARNPRSIFGLMESLKAQHRDHDAEWVQREFEAGWKDADAKLTVEEL